MTEHTSPNNESAESGSAQHDAVKNGNAENHAADNHAAERGTAERGKLTPSRRELFGMIGAGAAGIAVGAAGGAAAQTALSGGFDENRVDTVHGVVPFEGEHQAGITTEAQDRMHFASFELNRATSREDLIQLLKDWTTAARALTQGKDIGDGAVDGALLLPPDDTGEAHDLGAANLTLTFGFGRTLFADKKSGQSVIADPYGLRSKLPKEFEELPLFAFDLIDDAISGGDLCVQACADDPQVAVHAIRNLSRIAFGKARIKWTQLGFGRTSSTSRSQKTPRNLFGFKDGTASIKSDETEKLKDFVWIQKGDKTPDYLVGGTYLVARKIQMTIEIWDRQHLNEQQRVIGRTKGEGAPLSGSTEFETPNFKALNPDGSPVIDVDAHVRLAHSSNNQGVELLRRGYNYVDGSNELGQLNAGLFFITFQNDPAKFVQVQGNLKSDLLNEYIRHIGSSLWLVPPGVRSGEYIGQRIFEA